MITVEYYEGDTLVGDEVYASELPPLKVGGVIELAGKEWVVETIAELPLDPARTGNYIRVDVKEVIVDRLAQIIGLVDKLTADELKLLKEKLNG